MFEYAFVLLLLMLRSARPMKESVNFCGLGDIVVL
jgi:hypothetical protein